MHSNLCKGTFPRKREPLKLDWTLKRDYLPVIANEQALCKQFPPALTLGEITNHSLKFADASFLNLHLDAFF